MKFSDLVEHLSDRGFATRASWNGNLYVFFGMDNSFKSITRGHKYPSEYSMSLADIGASDWIRVQLWWDGPKDNWSPFTEKNIIYKLSNDDVEMVTYRVKRKGNKHVQRKTINTIW